VSEPGIIDIHAHAASDRFIPRSFVKGAVQNVAAMLRASGLPVSDTVLVEQYCDKLQDHDCDDFVAEMDRAGIAQSVLLAPDFSFVLKDCRLTVEEALLAHRDIKARHPGRFELFAGVDPRWGKDGVDLFERAVREMGFVGFKIYPPCGYGASDAGLDPFYEICATYRLPVMIHVGATSSTLEFGPARPMEVDTAAQRHPGVDFILAHASINYVDECAMLCEYRPNVYADISGFQSHLRSARGMGGVASLCGRGINHKILFGTDWPVFRMQGDQKEFVREALSAEGPIAQLPSAQASLILRKNAARLLAKRLTAAPATARPPLDPEARVTRSLS
jgi:predicted TIM-barrel fold metal-dependent hydrolase